MGLKKSSYEGKVCWEQNGQRLFDTEDVDKMGDQIADNLFSGMNESFGIIVVVFLLGLMCGFLLAAAVL